MTQEDRAADSPMRMLLQFFCKISRPPGQGNPAELKPAGGKHAKAGGDFVKADRRQPVVRRHECSRRGESRVGQLSRATIQTTPGLLDVGQLELEERMVPPMLNHVE